MENGWNLFNISNNNGSTNFGKVHNSRNCTNTTAAWEDVSESGTAATTTATNTTNTTSRLIINSHDSFLSSQQPLMLADDDGNRHHHHHHHNYINNYFPDPHLMCLKLGKRHYYGDAIAAGAAGVANYSIATKKGKPYYDYYDHDDGDAAAGGGGILVDDDHDERPSMSMNVESSTAAAPVPRCQVDGCNAVLLNAKDYHRRHKVCESHSKAPKVLVLGLEQRFCQQCSRFHAVSEFDESKRSCRRRLAGHNERRRKSSQQQQLHEHSIQSQVMNSGLMMTYPGRHAYLPLNSECALSLLSSKNDSWISATDLPARCSAALRELIAENRAAILTRQLILDKDWQWQCYYHHPSSAADQEMMINGRQQSGGLLLNSNNNTYQQQIPGSNNWERMSSEAADGHVTLDLMQAPNSAFGFLSAMRGKSKEDDEECPELWSTTSFGGAHVLN